MSLYATTSVPAIPPLSETTMLLDRHGNEVAKLHADVDRELIPFAQMPESLRRAVVAVEDADFYRHDGLDRMAVVRAMWRNLTSGSMRQGGSTITQQYVKNVLTGPEHSIGRKVREAILALKLEHTMSKGEILRGYLNTVYFGHGAYGVQAAAQTYFDRDAQDLTLLQSATLAGLISAPSARDPFVHPGEARLARNRALARMVEVGSVGPERAARLQARPLGLAEEARVRSAAPHFMEHVRLDLKASYGLDALYRGGLRVRTTLDMAWQRAAERAIRASLPSPTDPEAALVAIDPRTGAIRAMVGGRSFARSEFNLATQARRQAGSAFKPFVLVAALERGISPLEVRSGPSSLTIPDPFCETAGEPWTVSNAGDQAAGTMSIENALAGSVNTIFAQVTVEVGPDAVADVAHRMGIRSRLAPVCSIGLGTSEVTPLEMTSAYATLATRGYYVEPTAIERVTGPDGEVLQGPLGGLESVGSVAISVAGCGRDDACPARRDRTRHRHRGRPGRPSRRRQDRDGPARHGCVVLRLRPAARDLRVGRVPGRRATDARRGGVPGGLRRDDPRADLARLHERGHRGHAHRGVPRRELRVLRRSAASAGAVPLGDPGGADREPDPRALLDAFTDTDPVAVAGCPADTVAVSGPVTVALGGAGDAVDVVGRRGRGIPSGRAPGPGVGAAVSSEVRRSTSRRSVSATSRGARATSWPQVNTST